MEEKKLLNESTRQSLEAAQLEKINLEVQHLRSKGNRQDRFIQYTPLISVLIAVSGFLFGIYQYENQEEFKHNQIINEQEKLRKTQEADQAISIQNQIRNDFDQLLQFTSEKGQSVSKAMFLIQDLENLLRIKMRREQQVSEELQNEKRTMTASLVVLITNDCNFNELRDVDFAIAVSDNWTDYREYLKINPDKIVTLLGKFADALSEIYYRAPSYISRIQFDVKNNIYWEPKVYTVSDQSYFRHFSKLVTVFTLHQQFLAQDSELRKSIIKDFQAATCNESLTRILFNIGFDPKEDITAFDHCFKSIKLR